MSFQSVPVSQIYNISSQSCPSGSTMRLTRDSDTEREELLKGQLEQTTPE